MKRIQSQLLVLTLILLPFVGQAGEPASMIQFTRPLGMGGAFTAVADDHNIFNYNPAGMVQRQGAETTILGLAVGISQDFKDAYDFINEHQDELKNDNFQNLPPAKQTELSNEIVTKISKLNPRVYVAADVASFVSGPKFLGMPVHGAFGAFGVVDANFKVNFNVVPNVSYNVNNDIVIPLSFAKRFDAPYIPGTIGVGVTGKFMRRNKIQQTVSFAQMDDIKSPPLAMGRGLGSDVGLLYQPTHRVNVGLMVQDFLGTKLKYDKVEAKDQFPAQDAHTSVIAPHTNIGVALFPEKLLWLLPTGNRLTLSADVWDVLNKNEHVIFQRGLTKMVGDDLPKHVHLGAEYRWWFLRFRGGAYQGYPSFGLGIDIPILKIDYAYYSQELGARAGDIRQKNHVIQIAFQFGNSDTEARERIKSKKKVDKTPEGAENLSPNQAPPSAVPETKPVTPTPEKTSAPVPAATPEVKSAPTPVGSPSPAATATPATSTSPVATATPVPTPTPVSTPAAKPSDPKKKK